MSDRRSTHAISASLHNVTGTRACMQTSGAMHALSRTRTIAGLSQHANQAAPAGRVDEMMRRPTFPLSAHGIVRRTPCTSRECGCGGLGWHLWMWGALPRCGPSCQWQAAATTSAARHPCMRSPCMRANSVWAVMSSWGALSCTRCLVEGASWSVSLVHQGWWITLPPSAATFPSRTLGRARHGTAGT